MHPHADRIPAAFWSHRGTKPSTSGTGCLEEFKAVADTVTASTHHSTDSCDAP